MSQTYDVTHGSGVPALRFWFDGDDPVPPKSLRIGSLLTQAPSKRKWKFPHGTIGRHDPDLRRRLQEAQGE